MCIGDATREAALQTNLNFFRKPRGFGLSLGNREARHEVTLFERTLAPLRDRECVITGVGKITKNVPHLGGGLQVVLLRLELEPLRVMNRCPGLNAQQFVVSVGIRSVRVVQVVGRNEREVEFLGQSKEVCLDTLLDLEAMIHQLDVEVTLPENIAEFGSCLTSRVVLTESQASLDFATRAARCSDETRREARQQLAIHAGLVVLTFDGGERRHPEQIMHALCARRQKCHVRVGTTT
ncbi:unannotated protein [freshwater metagenome]|uniref:Unannotated protein n=1 Tax=freshwater metagenome TaxID=449393 RepID=A0A6J6DTG1_9ZZZZ